MTITLTRAQIRTIKQAAALSGRTIPKIKAGEVLTLDTRQAEAIAACLHEAAIDVTLHKADRDAALAILEGLKERAGLAMMKTDTHRSTKPASWMNRWRE